MPSIPARRQQPKPVPPQVPLPPDFPEIPQSIRDRFPDAVDWQRRLNEFWSHTRNAVEQAQQLTSAQINSTVIWTVDKFLIYTNKGGAMPMFALDDTGIRLGSVLVINTPGKKVYIGAGNYADSDTPFYVDALGRFSLGSNLAWDPDSSTLTIVGIINATSGTIGGFEIGADYIRDTADQMGLASTTTGGVDIRFWAGGSFANRDTALFRVDDNGDLFSGQFKISSNNIFGGDGTNPVNNPMVKINKTGQITVGEDGLVTFRAELFGTASGCGLYLRNDGGLLIAHFSIAAPNTDNTAKLVLLEATGATETVTIDGADGSVSVAGAETILNATGIPAGGTAGSGYKFSSTSNFGIFFGSGAPTLVAAKGSLYLRSDGSGIANRVYVATDSAGAWTNLVSAS